MTARPAVDPAAGPRISVIVIFYNSEAFLAEAVESALAQQGAGAFELLLVDDGSTDRSSAIARGFAEREPGRVRYLQHPGGANRGMSASRNRGLAAAHGELVAFLDSDDRWRPRKLAEQLAVFERLPALDAVCGTVNYWRSWAGGEDALVPTGHVRNRPIGPPEAWLALYPFGKAAAPCPSDLMVRRSTALALGGFEESFTGPLQLYEDQAFLTKLYLNGTVYFADAVWTDYRIHERACSSQVVAAGQYDAVRRHFLLWVERNLGALSRRPGFRVRARLQRALLPYRHPAVRRILRAGRSLLAKRFSGAA